MSNNPLDDLAPNILPEPIGLWPPAIGWWLLAGLIIAVLIVLLLLLWRYRQRTAYRRTGLRQLQQIEHSYEQHQDQQRLVKECNLVLKSVALHGWSRQTVASLNGDQWLAFLHRQGPNSDSAFTADGCGCVLGLAGYAREIHIQPRQLLAATRHWIRKHHV